MQNTTTKKSKNIMNMFSGKQILIPIAALLLLAVFNLSLIHILAGRLSERTAF